MTAIAGLGSTELLASEGAVERVYDLLEDGGQLWMDEQLARLLGARKTIGKFAITARMADCANDIRFRSKAY